MPKRKAVDLLPELIRSDLNSRLIAGGFSGYEALSEWLQAKGFGISKSALHRYGTKFEERCQSLKLATDQAKAIVAESPDDEGAMNEALIRLVQEKSFNLLMDLEIDPETIEFPKLVRAIADSSRASVGQKKYRAEVRKTTLDEAASAAHKAARKKGISEDTADFIRRQILGIGDGQPESKPA